MTVSRFDLERAWTRPRRKTRMSAGLDVAACQTIRSSKKSSLVVNTNLRVTPHPGWFVWIRERSSFAVRGLTVHGGIVDADYEGEVFVVLFNCSDEDIVIRRGQYYAQMIHMKYSSNVIGNFIEENKERK